MRRVLLVIVGLLSAVAVLPLSGGVASAAQLPAPTLSSPGNAVDVTANPTFQWQPVAGATQYKIQIATDSNWGTLLFDVNTVNVQFTPWNDLPQLPALAWRVAAFDVNNQLGNFASRTFSKSLASAPTNTKPVSGTTFSYPTEAPSFSWDAYAGAKYYKIQISTNDTFTPPLLVDDITYNTSYTLSDPQPVADVNASPYYWRVQAYSQNDRPTNFSASQTYGVGWPATVNPISPPNQTSPAIEEVVLEWNSVPGAVSYDVQVSQINDFTGALVVNGTVYSTRYSPPVTLNNGTYYWRVRARNWANSTGAFNQPWTFQRSWPPTPIGANGACAGPGAGVNCAPPFNTVNLLTPADQDFAVSVPTFSWTPVRLASSYLLQLSTDSFFSPGVTANCYTNHTQLTPKLDCGVNPAPGTQYWWRVQPLDAPGGINGIPSATRTFDYFPPIPTRTTPNGTSSPLPVLSWNQVPNIARYRVTWIDKNGGVGQKDTTNTSFVPQGVIPALSPYSWYVQTIDAFNRPGLIPGGNGSFTVTAPTLTAAPTITSPAGQTGVFAPVLTWTPVTGADSYRIWYAPNAPGSNVFNQLGPNLSSPGYAHTESDLPSGNWKFYVDAMSGNTVVATSPAISTFTMGYVPAPGSPPVSFVNTTLTGPCPTNAACTQYDTPTLTWNSVGGAGIYQVVLANDPAFTNIFATYYTQYTTITPQESLLDSAAGQSIYWYARPCSDLLLRHCGPDAGSFAGAPPIRAFHKVSRAVTQVSPADNAQVPNQITFNWTDYLTTNTTSGAPNVYQEAKWYHLQVSTSSDFSQVIDDRYVDQTTYTEFDNTYPEGPLFWRVQAIDGSDHTLTWSATRLVTKKAPLIANLSPGVVTINPAAYEQVGGVPTLKWTAQDFAAQYEVQLYRSPDQPLSGANIVFSQVTRQPAATAKGVLPPGDYGWRVRRYDAAGKPGPWTTSATVPENNGLYRFTIAPTKPVLVSPGPPGGPVPTVAGNRLYFTWKAVGGASQYRLETNTAADFSSPDTENSVTVGSPSGLNTSWASFQNYPSGTYFWRVTTLDASGAPQAISAVGSFIVGSPSARYKPVVPFRVLDSRGLPGSPTWTNPAGAGKLVQGQPRMLQVTGTGGVAAGASAVVLNVTATGGDHDSFLTVYPFGDLVPNASNVNFATGQTIPNLVTVKVGVAGQIAFNNALGSVDVVADVVGYYDDGTNTSNSLYTGMNPVRMLDSRTVPQWDGGGGAGALTAGSPKTLNIAGKSGVPMNATAAVMNITVTGGTSNSFLTAYPAGGGVPNASNVNFAIGQTIPNLAIVQLGSGAVSFANQSGSVQVIVDVVGYFTQASGQYFHVLAPNRILDSRVNNGLNGPWTPQTEKRDLQVAGRGGVPLNGVDAVVMNTTATGGTLPSFLTLFPTGQPVPTASNVNFGPGQTIPNLVMVKLGTAGQVTINNAQGSVDVIGDVVGYFSTT